MSIRTATRVLARASLVLGGGTATALTAGEYAGSDSGAVRSYRFWKASIPIYTHYKYVEWKMKDEPDSSKRSAAYRPLNKKYSPRVERLALDFKGFYFKLAQIMSTRDDFLADEYLEWTKRLQDKAPCVMPSSDVCAIVAKSLDVNVDTHFSEWDDEPVGAASVGQVHRARLASDGTEVAVKVQYPGIERKFRNDIETVELFCKYLMPQHTAYFAEIKRQFATEFDMRGEAENLRLVHGNLEKAGWDQFVAVPVPLDSSKQVLVMTYLHGQKLVDGMREQFARLAKSQGRSLQDFEDEQKRLMESGQFKRVDVRDAARTSRYLRWLVDARNSVVNVGILTWNWTGGVMASVVVGDAAVVEYWDSKGMFNLGEIMDLLLRVHGHEIFTDGAFNGDPHPGNILLMDDGRIGLVDYGQLKRMAVSDRIMYARLILALSRDDRDEVVRLMRDEVGLRTRQMNEDVIYRAAAFFHCRDSEDVLGGMNVSEFIEWMDRTDRVVKINDELVMVGRVSLLLRGLASAFGMKVRVSHFWKDEASKFLKSQGIDY